VERVVKSLVSVRLDFENSRFLRGVKMRLTDLSETITCNLCHVIWWTFGVRSNTDKLLVSRLLLVMRKQQVHRHRQ
jgi:hypothetical protein